jgi:hypothetical protein
MKDATLLRANLLRGANMFQTETWKAIVAGARLDLAHVAGSKLLR